METQERVYSTLNSDKVSNARERVLLDITCSIMGLLEQSLLNPLDQFSILHSAIFNQFMATCRANPGHAAEILEKFEHLNRDMLAHVREHVGSLP